eukprot:7426025-Lingulodinium_polyedra.AAC.1
MARAPAAPAFKHGACLFQRRRCATHPEGLQAPRAAKAAMTRLRAAATSAAGDWPAAALGEE